MLLASRERSLSVVDLDIWVVVVVRWVLPLLVTLVPNTAAEYKVCHLLHCGYFLVHLMDRLLKGGRLQHWSLEVLSVVC